MSDIKEETLDMYDKLCSITIINIYSLSKDTEEIIISPTSSKQDLFFVNACIAAASNFGRKLYLALNPFKFLVFVIKNFGFKGFKYFKFKFNSKPNIIINDVLKFEAEGNDVDISIFDDIYTEYYEHI